MTRRSVRGFLDKPVARDVLQRILETAARAPSGANPQSWHIQVVAGDALADLKQIMLKRVEEAPQGETAEYDIYPKELVAPHSTAFSAGSLSPGNIIAIERARPICCGKNHVAPMSGTMPSFGRKGVRK